MIQNEFLAKTIEMELNENPHTKHFNKHFKVHSNVGDFTEYFTRRNDVDLQEINCVLKQSSGEYTALKDVNNVFVNYTFECAIQQDFSDELILILSSWSEQIKGQVYSDNEWTYLITPTPINVGTAMDTCALGSTIPMTISLAIQMIQKGLISNVVKWYIDGEEIPHIRAQFNSLRTSDTLPLLNNQNTTSQNIYNTKTIILNLPYINNAICKKIANNILKNDINEQFIVERKDGIADNIKLTMIITQGAIIEENEKIVALSCTLNEAFME